MITEKYGQRDIFIKNTRDERSSMIKSWNQHFRKIINTGIFLNGSMMESSVMAVLEKGEDVLNDAG